MGKAFLTISIKEKKTKLAVFNIDERNSIIINEVQIINSFISKKKAQKIIKKNIKKFDIQESVISVYNNCIEGLEDIFSSFNLKYELLSELFVISEAIKVIDKNELKAVDTKPKYIKNGWLDFSQINHIDLNGLIHYKLNSMKE